MHFGPTAQDFYAAFELGDSDLAIGLQDADGVALAAIQGLNAKLEATVAEQAREIAELRVALNELGTRQRAELAELRHAVELLAGQGSSDLNLARR
jgi:uncharacterized coiled-coil protein SlyX